MKKSIFLFFVILFSYHTTCAQTLTVEYHRKINANSAVLSKSDNFKMVISGNKSFFYNITNDSLKYKYKKFIENIKDLGSMRLVQLDDNTYDYTYNEVLFKNYEKDTLLLNALIVNRLFFLGEKIDKFHWVIKNDITKIILGKHCIAAKTTFRGRSYTAFFTTELASFSGGPWKFDGLPGVILSIKSDDNYVSFKASKIRLNKNDAQIKNVFKGRQIISWNEYVAKYKKIMERLLKRLKSLSDDGQGGNIKVTDEIEDLGIGKLQF